MDGIRTHMRPSAAFGAESVTRRAGSSPAVVALPRRRRPPVSADVVTAAASERRRFAADVRHGLMQRPARIPSQYLYDELGSALFEAICQLPWYPIARAETALLAGCADVIAARVTPVARVVELGPGSGQKLATFLAAVDRPTPPGEPVSVELVDVSEAALAQASQTVAAIDGVRVSTHCTSYERGLDLIGGAPPRAGRTLVLLLGSNIGNFESGQAEALLQRVGAALRPGDALLLGTDLVKPEADLVLAYDDPLGVTAAFNRNLMVRMNRELDADFDVSRFVHLAHWRSDHERIECYLVSTARQDVRIGAADLLVSFDRGDRIWTESSCKYRPEGVQRMLGRAGFAPAGQWVAEAGFALTLAQIPPD